MGYNWWGEEFNGIFVQRIFFSIRIKIRVTLVNYSFDGYQNKLALLLTELCGRFGSLCDSLLRSKYFIGVNPSRNFPPYIS